MDKAVFIFFIFGAKGLVHLHDAVFLNKKNTERARHKAIIGLLSQFPSTQYGRRNQNVSIVWS